MGLLPLTLIIFVVILILAGLAVAFPEVVTPVLLAVLTLGAVLFLSYALANIVVLLR